MPRLSLFCPPSWARSCCCPTPCDSHPRVLYSRAHAPFHCNCNPARDGRYRRRGSARARRVGTRCPPFLRKRHACLLSPLWLTRQCLWRTCPAGRSLEDIAGGRDTDVGVYGGGL